MVVLVNQILDFYKVEVVQKKAITTKNHQIIEIKKASIQHKQNTRAQIYGVETTKI
jgi:hypothetical protein